MMMWITKEHKETEGGDVVLSAFPDIMPTWQKHFAHGNQRKRNGPARTDSASACRQKMVARSWQGADKKVEKR